MVFIFLFLQGVATAAPTAHRCIVGDPSDSRLIQIFNAPPPRDGGPDDNSPIRLWRAEREPPKTPPPTPTQCNDCRQEYLFKIMELQQRIRQGWTLGTKISYHCVREALSSSKGGVLEVKVQEPLTMVAFSSKGSKAVHRPPTSPNCKATQGNEYLCPTETLICRGEKTPPQRKIGDVPCVTAEMAEYIAWTVNQAITCHSREDDPLDRRTIFKKLNNESQFLFPVRNRNGIGLPQLVPIGVREVLHTERGYKSIIQPIKEMLKPGVNFSQPGSPSPTRVKACKVFADVLNRTPAVESSGNTLPFPECSLLHPGIGVARAIFLGIAHFAHATYTYTHNGEDISATTLVRKGLHFDPSTDLKARELRDHIALSYYSAAGIERGKAFFDETKRALGCGTKRGANCTPTNFLARFRAEMGKEFPYFNHIDKRYRQLLYSLDKDLESVAYTPEDLRGDRCLE